MALFHLIAESFISNTNAKVESKINKKNYIQFESDLCILSLTLFSASTLVS